MLVLRAVVVTLVLFVLLAAPGWASGPPITDQVAAALALPDESVVILDGVFVNNVFGQYASVRDTWAQSQSLLISTDAAIQPSWTIKVTGQMATIDGQRVLVASSVQLYVNSENGAAAPPFPPYLLATWAGISLVDVPAVSQQRSLAPSLNFLEVTTEEFDGSIASAKRVGGDVTLADKVVTAVFHDENGAVTCFYIQEPGGSGGLGIYGIRVDPGFPVPVQAGDVVTVHGKIVPSPGDTSVAECHVDAGYDLLREEPEDSRHVICTCVAPLPRPLGIINKFAANGEFGLQPELYRGAATPSTRGFGIVGSLVRIWGRVVETDSTQHVYWIDDGSGLTWMKSEMVNGQPTYVAHTGIRVIYDSATTHLVGAMVAGVTGALGAEMDDAGNFVPVLRVPTPEAVPEKIVHVKTTGSSTGNGATWSAAVTLPHALDIADPGDEIWVAAGTYYGNLVMADGAALYGGFTGDISETHRWQRDWVNNTTILDGEETGAVITVADCTNPATLISGFRICNGISCDDDENSRVYDQMDGYPAGGGIRCTDSSLTIRDNVIVGNRVHSRADDPDGYNQWGTGAGVYCADSTALIWNNSFGVLGSSPCPNQCMSGQAVCIEYCDAHSVLLDNIIECNAGAIDWCDNSVWGSAVVWNSTLGAIAYNAVSNNEVEGMYVLGSEPAPAEADICGNVIADNGGTGISARFVTLTVRNNCIAGCGGRAIKVQNNHEATSFTDNLIENNAGGLALSQGDESNALPCGQATISGNKILNNWCGTNGAAIWCACGECIIKDNVIQGNYSTASCGAGVMLDDSTSGGDPWQVPLPTPMRTAVVERNTFRGNAGSSRGAGLAAYWGDDVTIQNNLFVQNQCTGSDNAGGGAIETLWCSPVIVNNTFVQNWVGTLEQDGIFPAEGDDVFADVIPAAYGGAILIRSTPLSESGGFPAVVLNNIFYDNMADQGKAVACKYGGQADVAYCDAAPTHSQAWFYYWDTGDEQCSLSIDTSSCHYAEPGFASGAYSLTPSSLLVTLYHGTSSSPAPATDILGCLRPQGAYTEMGAYEAAGSP